MQALGPRSLSSILVTVLKLAGALVAIGIVATVFIWLMTVGVAVAHLGHPLPAGFMGAKDVPTLLTRLPLLTYHALAALCALLVIRRLQQLLASFVANEPFAPDNAGHLRVIWVTLLVVEVAKLFASGFSRALLPLAQGAVLPQSMVIENPVDLQKWFLIFVIIVLAEVFRIGAALRKETELTV
jgi:Protein of unknown function (DUF2975)